MISRRTFLASSAAASLTAGVLAGGHGALPPHDCRIVGVGGGGLRSLSAIGPLVGDLAQVIAVSTDRQDLVRASAPRQHLLAPELTGGLGAGSNPEVGREAALTDAATLRELMRGADSVVLVGGLGGGTATGAMPVLAELGSGVTGRTIAVATMPFWFEGKRRREQTTGGLFGLRDTADLLIPLPLQALAPYGDGRIGLKEVFAKADRVVARVTDTARLLSLLAVRGVVPEPRGRGGAGVGAHSDPLEAVAAAFRSPLMMGPVRPEAALVHLRGRSVDDRGAEELRATVREVTGIERVVLAQSAGDRDGCEATALVTGERGDLRVA